MQIICIYVYMYRIESMGLVYLPTFPIKIKPNVGKYTIITWILWVYLVDKCCHRLIDIVDIGHLYGGIRLHVETISMNTMTMRGAH